MTILEVHNLKKVYTTRFGGNQVQALRNIQFSVEEGEYVAIMGESGSGKSVTALSLIGLLDDNAHVSGSVKLNGEELIGKSDEEIAAYVKQMNGVVQRKNKYVRLILEKNYYAYLFGK